MYQSVNIGLGSLEKIPKNLLHVLAMIIPSRQEDIFYLNVHSIESLGIQKSL